MTNKLIVFATYWNEIDWVRSSLEQIDKIYPCEIIISDGCFDSRYPAHSTDGTREIIEKFVHARPHAFMIAPVRTNRLGVFVQLLRGHGKGSPWRVFTPARLKSLLTVFLFGQYRLNQALTFQRMIRLSRAWAPGWWFMTYDADQYYSDEMIEAFRNIEQFEPAALVCGHEMTFFANFDYFTDLYELRHFNNMPHKILPGTNIMPTRDIVIESFSAASLRRTNFMKSDRYTSKVKSVSIGNYHHYKFRRRIDRTAQGYMVGDRKRPDVNQYSMKPFTGRHPEIVERLIRQWTEPGDPGDRS